MKFRKLWPILHIWALANYYIMSSQDQVKMYTRARSKRRMLDVDLNTVLPCESRDQDGPLNHTRSHDRQAVQGGATMPPSIDVDALDDDDVIISSPRAFAEAKNNSKKVRGHPILVDVDSDERSVRYKRRRVSTNSTTINCGLHISLNGSSSPKRKNVQPLPPAPPPPKESTFSCPVCLGALVEETSTKCGHIFCKACIKAAIAAQSKCPTCRTRTTAKDIFRIYLPTTTVA
ncbi:hypothetical protein OROGR_022235 [Orobanche gracilis]